MKPNRAFTALLGSAVALCLATGIDSAARAQAQARTAPPGPEFSKLDVNHDGYISREEARRLRDFSAAFDQADDNHDGRLDPDEFFKAQSIHERMRLGKYVDDTMITAKVKAALVKDPDIRSVEVTVETYKGEVLLSGFVDNARQVRRAAEIASGVRGVVAVKNSLLVRS